MNINLNRKKNEVRPQRKHAAVQHHLCMTLGFAFIRQRKKTYDYNFSLRNTSDFFPITKHKITSFRNTLKFLMAV